MLMVSCSRKPVMDCCSRKLQGSISLNVFGNPSRHLTPFAGNFTGFDRIFKGFQNPNHVSSQLCVPSHFSWSEYIDIGKRTLEKLQRTGSVEAAVEVRSIPFADDHLFKLRNTTPCETSMVYRSFWFMLIWASSSSET